MVSSIYPYMYYTNVADYNNVHFRNYLCTSLYENHRFYIMANVTVL